MRRLGGLALVLAALLAPRAASAWPRPHDAPAVDAARPVPEVTPEYAAVEANEFTPARIGLAASILTIEPPGAVWPTVLIVR